MLSPLHLAVFASGAAIGAGSAAVYASQTNKKDNVARAQPQPVSTPTIPTRSTSIHTPQDVIKFGFPGGNQ